ncbi:DNA polymerase III subunit delta [Actinobacillus porcinus]|uniref:DNA polymerase III subunit delta n=1 Tax=Actinobacillus porcinus TaxID=51048 RepID=UPI002356874E|nr:DNA polymerase III subunit delta [Actinobacillus porcinus]
MNRIFPEQLNHSLGQRLASLYYLTGQDPLLLAETRDLIIQTATAQGFDEKIDIQVDQSTDWDDLFECCQSMGLFFNKQVISLTLPENLTAALQAKLFELISLSHEDVLLILQLTKFGKANEKQEWVKKSLEIEPHLTVVNCQTPGIEQLPRWVSHRVKAMGLSIEQDAIQLLCYSYENNLLALKQTLELLALLYPDHKISFTRVKSVVEQASVFTPFQWIDALLEGKEGRARRILESLKAEEMQPVILLRTLQRELMTLLELSKPQQRLTGIDQPLPTHQLKEGFDRLKIWQNRRHVYSALFQRFTYRKLYKIIQQLAELERLAKLEFSNDIWDKLADISIKFAIDK